MILFFFFSGGVPALVLNNAPQSGSECSLGTCFNVSKCDPLNITIFPLIAPADDPVILWDKNFSGPSFYKKMNPFASIIQKMAANGVGPANVSSEIRGHKPEREFWIVDKREDACLTILDDWPFHFMAYEATREYKNAPLPWLEQVVGDPTNTLIFDQSDRSFVRKVRNFTAILALVDLDKVGMRRNFDIASPYFPQLPNDLIKTQLNEDRPNLACFSGTVGSWPPVRKPLVEMNDDDKFKFYDIAAQATKLKAEAAAKGEKANVERWYRNLLRSCKFGVVAPGGVPNTFRLIETMQHGAVPVVLGAERMSQMPFADLVPWDEFTIRVDNVTEIKEKILAVDDATWLQMKKKSDQWFFKAFQDEAHYVWATVQIFADRIQRHMSEMKR